MPGPVEAAVQSDLDALGASASPVAESLSQLALTLARQLDDGAGMAAAAISKELRATLALLTSTGGDDDGLAELIGRLSAPVRDPAVP